MAGRQHAVDRLRPEDAAQQVVDRDHDRRRHQHPPVAVEREERERAEHVEVRLDAAAGQVDQQRRRQHLADGDRVARHGQPGRRTASAMGSALIAPPRKTAAQTWMLGWLVEPAHVARRDPERRRDAEQPLHGHQHREHAVGLDERAPLQVVERLVRPPLRRLSTELPPSLAGGEVSSEDVASYGVGRRAGSRIRRAPHARASAIDKGLDRVAAGVVAGMAAGEGDAAVERELACASKTSVWPRDEGAEARRLVAVASPLTVTPGIAPPDPAGRSVPSPRRSCAGGRPERGTAGAPARAP